MIFYKVSKFLAANKKAFKAKGFISVRVSFNYLSGRDNSNSIRNNLNMRLSNKEVNYGFCKIDREEESIFWITIRNCPDALGELEEILESSKSWDSYSVTERFVVTKECELPSLAEKIMTDAKNRTMIGFGVQHLPAVVTHLIQEEDEVA